MNPNFRVKYSNIMILPKKQEKLKMIKSKILPKVRSLQSSVSQDQLLRDSESNKKLFSAVLI